jgi:hypothetical protein
MSRRRRHAKKQKRWDTPWVIAHPEVIEAWDRKAKSDAIRMEHMLQAEERKAITPWILEGGSRRRDRVAAPFTLSLKTCGRIGPLFVSRVLEPAMKFCRNINHQRGISGNLRSRLIPGVVVA